MTGLFGGAYERRIDDHDALVALAARVPAHVRFGTSSWTFPAWKSLVYVETSDALEEYARHPLFRTVGIDRSFYAPLSRETLRAYAQQLPPSFRAVSKVWSELTTPVFPKHERFGARAGQPSALFLDAATFTREIAEPFRDAFADHTGPFVLEVPRAPARLDADAFADAVGAFLAEVPRPNDYAIELRDPKLLTARYLDVLAAHDATHVFNWWTRMPELRAQLALPGALRRETRVVVRLMVPPKRKYEDLKKAWAPFDRLVEPNEAMRDDVAEIVRRAGELGCEAFVIANNKAEGCAPLTVRALAERIAA